MVFTSCTLMNTKTDNLIKFPALSTRLSEILSGCSM